MNRAGPDWDHVEPVDKSADAVRQASNYGWDRLAWEFHLFKGSVLMQFEPLQLGRTKQLLNVSCFRELL
jgi:hypothetical protein